MAKDTLIFKDKNIRNNDLELIFHKDHYWIYNEEQLPVVKYTLSNCQNLASIDFHSIDCYNDGLIVDIRKENDHSVFETTDMGDIKVKIICDKIEKEEREYNTHDFVDLIKEILKQRDGEHDLSTKFTKQIEDLKQFLNHEHDIITKKIDQAGWVSEDKKHFLQGQQDILKKVIQKIEKKEK
jgi:hypothetical protein